MLENFWNAIFLMTGGSYTTNDRTESGVKDILQNSCECMD
jgi:hypothetical protein